MFLKRFFIVSLILAAFAWGYIAREKKYFPYTTIEKAKVAYKALQELRRDPFRQVYRGKPLWYPMWEGSGIERPTATTFKPSRGNEKVLILGTENSLLDVCPEVGCLAWIVDREGKVLHAWKNKPDLWKLDRHNIGSHHYIYPVSAHLYPNGDLLVSYHGNAVFPYAIGLAKFDKDSHLIWKKEDYYHHWFTVDRQGRILSPAIELVDSPFKVDEDRKMKMVCDQGVVTAEYVAILDPQGEEIDRIDMTTAFSKSDMIGMLYDINFCDPYHLNMVGINEDPVNGSPMLDPGDFLVSFRSLSLVGAVGKDSKLFKWYFKGPLAKQHSSIFYKGDEIFVLDNYGGVKSKGTTRVVAIDMKTDKMTTLFPREGVEIPPSEYFISTGGFITVHPDRARMMVAFTYPAGFVWEIDINSGEVLWEYRNITPIADKFLRLPIYTALYLQDITFPLNNGQFK